MDRPPDKLQLHPCTSRLPPSRQFCASERQATNQTFEKQAGGSSHQLPNLPASQPSRQQTIQLASQPANHPISRQAGQPAKPQANHPTSLAGRPACQLAGQPSWAKQSPLAAPNLPFGTDLEMNECPTFGRRAITESKTFWGSFTEVDHRNETSLRGFNGGRSPGRNQVKIKWEIRK